MKKLNEDDELLFIEKEDEGKRIDAFISEATELSRANVQRLLSSGDIFVNGKTVNKSYKTSNGDEISLHIPEPEITDILPENIPLDILYEDNELIVINKPQGMVVHPAPGHISGTVVNALMYHCKDGLSGINGELRPGIVHRIDKDTSGVIVAAKTDRAHISLSEQLAAHSMTRLYNAIVYNGFSEPEGTVSTLIGRAKNDRKKMAVLLHGGREAVTHYRVLEALGKYTLVELKLETGRTHQIRVHMAHIGHPLVGDTVYGSGRQTFSLNGQCLHARVLGFIHPVSGEYMEFSSPLPDYFETLLKRLRT